MNDTEPGVFVHQPHTDGPLYYPTVTTVSLGDHTVLDFYKPLESHLSAAEPHSNDNCCQPSGDERTAECMLSSTEVLVSVNLCFQCQFMCILISCSFI